LDFVKHEINQSFFYASKAIDERLSRVFDTKQAKEDFYSHISTPPKQYHFRINLAKTAINDLINTIKVKFTEFSCASGSLENSLLIEVKGPHQIPLAEKAVSCDKFAAETVMMGADLYIPGVKQVENKFDPNEFIALYLARSDYPRIDIIEEIPEHFFHVATGKAVLSSKQFAHQTTGLFINNTFPRYQTMNFHNSQIYEQGLLSDQNYPANLACAILVDKIIERHNIFPENDDNQPVIFDTCSAPGHKTAALAEWYYYRTLQLGQAMWAKIISIDRSANRLKHLEKDLLRLGLRNIELFPCHLEKIEKKRPELLAGADFLLFDPPCSALGTRPKLYLEKSESELDDFPKNQRRLLKIVDKLLKPNGILMYNTCTLPIEENEAIVAYAIDRLGYKILKIPDDFKQSARGGLSFDILQKQETEQLMRMYPDKANGIGYFIALLQKP
jgi:16S rRNA C967 or C1407 C5-methylase (RsmB/RsmF family)